MNHNTPGLPVHHQLPEFTQTHVHRVSDAIQPSHPLSSPSPPAPNPSQRQSLCELSVCICLSLFLGLILCSIVLFIYPQTGTPGFPDGSVSKESACNAGDTRDMGSIPESGRSFAGRKWQPVPVFLPENPMDRGVWQAAEQSLAESDTTV